MAKVIYDAGNAAHVQQRTEELEEEVAREAEWLKKIVDTYQGRWFLWRLMGRCKIFHKGYYGDVNDLLVNDGMRTIGLEILTEVLTLHPKAFTLMQSEATARDNKRSF